jgi:hypothetical protein
MKATVDPEWGLRRPTELRRHAQHVEGGLKASVVRSLPTRFRICEATNRRNLNKSSDNAAHIYGG